MFLAHSPKISYPPRNDALRRGWLPRCPRGIVCYVSMFRQSVEEGDRLRAGVLVSQGKTRDRRSLSRSFNRLPKAD